MPPIFGAFGKFVVHPLLVATTTFWDTAAEREREILVPPHVRHVQYLCARTSRGIVSCTTQVVNKKTVPEAVNSTPTAHTFFSCTIVVQSSCH